MTSRPPRNPIVPPGQIELMPRDMTVTMVGDVTLGQVSDRLAEHNQWLPIDGPRDATIAALVLRNSTGPLRLGYGAWRDFLLGCQFQTGDGRLISAGGRVIKNVAGYDLTKLIVGSFGCFGDPATFTARTYRKPTHALQLRFNPNSDILTKIFTTPLRPQYALLTADALRLGYLGDERTIAFYRSESAKIEPRDTIDRSADDDIAEHAQLWAPSAAPNAFRAAVPPTRLREFIAQANLTDHAADPAFGIVVGPTPSPSQLGEIARSLGGSCVRFDELGQPLPLDLPPETQQLLIKLKQVFDPSQRFTRLPILTA